MTARGSCRDAHWGLSRWGERVVGWIDVVGFVVVVGIERIETVVGVGDVVVVSAVIVMMSECVLRQDVVSPMVQHGGVGYHQGGMDVVEGAGVTSALVVGG